MTRLGSVDEVVIVELKVARTYQSADEAQLLNELKATGIKLGLLINFGQPKIKDGITRVVNNLPE